MSIESRLKLLEAEGYEPIYIKETGTYYDTGLEIEISLYEIKQLEEVDYQNYLNDNLDDFLKEDPDIMDLLGGMV